MRNLASLGFFYAKIGVAGYSDAGATQVTPMLHMLLVPKSTILGLCLGRKGGAEQAFQSRSLKSCLNCLMRCRLTRQRMF